MYELRGGYAVACALAVAATVAAAPAASAAARAGCASPFTEPFITSLAQRFPGQRVTAAVYDTRTGCWYHLYRGLRISTASVIKAQVLGAVLLKAQDERRNLTTSERTRVAQMISYSLDPPTSSLYGHIGGVGGMRSYDRRAGIGATQHTSRYGGTATTAQDRTQVAVQLLYGGGPLGAAGRAHAWHYMSRVHPTQQWGITAGVPDGWYVALKNGFYPSRLAAWRVGSTGFVRRRGSPHGYAITVMTNRNADQLAGIRLVEAVSRQVASALTDGVPARRLVERAQCVAPVAGESWPSVARRLGVPARWRDVQTVSGGNPRTMRGMRACSPVLSAR